MHSAREEPSIAVISGVQSWSTDKHGVDDLHLVAEAIRKQRTDRTVDHAGRQRGMLAGPPLAAQEAARDLTDRVQLFFIADGQREKVNSFLSADCWRSRSTGRPYHRNARRHEPPACLAISPVSTVITRPQKSKRNTCLAILSPLVFLNPSYDSILCKGTQNKPATFAMISPGCSAPGRGKEHFRQKKKSVSSGLAMAIYADPDARSASCSAPGPSSLRYASRFLRRPTIFIRPRCE